MLTCFILKLYKSNQINDTKSEEEDKEEEKEIEASLPLKKSHKRTYNKQHGGTETGNK